MHSLQYTPVERDAAILALNVVVCVLSQAMFVPLAAFNPIQCRSPQPQPPTFDGGLEAIGVWTPAAAASAAKISIEVLVASVRQDFG